MSVCETPGREIYGWSQSDLSAVYFYTTADSVSAQQSFIDGDNYTIKNTLGWTSML